MNCVILDCDWTLLANDDGDVVVVDGVLAHLHCCIVAQSMLIVCSDHFGLDVNNYRRQLAPADCHISFHDRVPFCNSDGFDPNRAPHLWRPLWFCALELDRLERLTLCCTRCHWRNQSAPPGCPCGWELMYLAVGGRGPGQALSPDPFGRAMATPIYNLSHIDHVLCNCKWKRFGLATQRIIKSMLPNSPCPHAADVCRGMKTF